MPDNKSHQSYLQIKISYKSIYTLLLALRPLRDGSSVNGVRSVLLLLLVSVLLPDAGLLLHLGAWLQLLQTLVWRLQADGELLLQQTSVRLLMLQANAGLLLQTDGGVLLAVDRLLEPDGRVLEPKPRLLEPRTRLLVLEEGLEVALELGPRPRGAEHE